MAEECEGGVGLAFARRFQSPSASPQKHIITKRRNKMNKYARRWKIEGGEGRQKEKKLFEW